MNEEKKWYESRGVWGGFVAVIAGVAGALGYALDAGTQEQLVNLAIAGASAIGGVLAVIGRLNATKSIKRGEK